MIQCYVDLPQSYTISKFLIHTGNPTQYSQYLVGGCPSCHEGSSWGTKRRLYYYISDDFLYCYNCFAGDVKILTLEYGAIEFKKIKNEFVTVKCKDGVWRKRQIKSYGQKQVYEYIFGNVGPSDRRYRIKATEDHTWFIKRDKKRRKYDVTTSLQIGDRLDSVNHIDDYSLDGIIHGIIFGDGTYRLNSRGEKRWAYIRVCKQDSRKDEILELLSKFGKKIQYFPSYNGDAYVNIGNILNLKDVPNTLDPKYIAGFIYGLWLTDGASKCRHSSYEISSVRKDLVDWFERYAAIGGFRMINVPKPVIRTNCFANAKPIYTIVVRRDSDIVLREKIKAGIEEVFCIEEPITGGFYLDDNILTGNCSRSWNPYWWVRETTGMSYREILEDLKDNGNDSDYILEYTQAGEKTWELPDLPGECVNLKSETQYDYYKKLKIVKHAYDYCSERRIFTALNSPRAIYVCVKDLYHENRLIIPCYDSNNRIISYTSRQLLDNDKKAKYMLKFNAKKLLFGFDKIDPDFPYVFLCEGQVDSMFLKNAVALSGLDLNEDQEEQLKSIPLHKRIWIYDNLKDENDDVRKKAIKKLQEGESIFLFKNEFQDSKDLNEFCIQKKLDSIDPALILENTFLGGKGIINL